MHNFLLKRRAIARLLLLLATLSVSASISAQEEVYLPTVGDPAAAVRVEQPDVEPLDRESNAETNEFTGATNDLDVLGPILDESRYQDGDGPWAERPEGVFREWSEVTAAAFNANNWYVQNKLGVGTDTPVHRVELNDNVNWVNRLLIRNNNGGSDVSSDIYLTTGTAKGLMIQKFGSGFNKFNWSGLALADWARIRTDTGVKGLIQTTASGQMIFGTGDTERFRIHANGGMTIRNTNSSFGLRIQDTDYNGLLVTNADYYGVRVEDSLSDGVYIENAGYNGINIERADTNGVWVNRPGNIGFIATNAWRDGVHVVDPDDDFMADPRIVLYMAFGPGIDGVDRPARRWVPLESNELFGGWQVYAELNRQGEVVLHDPVGQAELAEMSDMWVAHNLRICGWLEHARPAAAAVHSGSVEKTFAGDTCTDAVDDAAECPPDDAG